MKRGFHFLIALALTIYFIGCSAEKDLGKKVYVYGYNFSDYTKQGFLFTPEQYLGEYESIGILEVEIYPEINPQGKRVNQYGAENYGEIPKWVYYPVQTKEVLDSLFNIGRRMGADAVVRLEITDVAQERTRFLYPIPGKRASGFAIKRKK